MPEHAPLQPDHHRSRGAACCSARRLQGRINRCRLTGKTKLWRRPRVPHRSVLRPHCERAGRRDLGRHSHLLGESICGYDMSIAPLSLYVLLGAIITSVCQLFGRHPHALQLPLSGASQNMEVRSVLR
jgi:hypothetical protein